MANYSQKLTNLRSRRHGLDSGTVLSKSARTLDASVISEAYETRGKTDSIKYALGAMQELEPKYTQVCFQEGDRIKNQLQSGLQSADISATFEYQGSVPLNIHIRYASDVDLLVLHGDYLTNDANGSRAAFYRSSGGSMLGHMLLLRNQCEAILEKRFPQATIDKSGAKSIAISGGSLQRKVDVVPSHWHDSAQYQQTGTQHDRVVKILDKENLVLLPNLPFLHMKRINNKDTITGGGAKKAIRLLKNLKKDSAYRIDLSSYDIAALVWHFSDQALTKPYYLELSLVAETQKHLQYMLTNSDWTKSLMVPDGTRKIIDKPTKMHDLSLLKREVDELASSIAKELQPWSYANEEKVRQALMETHIF